MKNRLLFASLFFCFFTFLNPQLNAQINGPSEVCVESCEFYSVQTVDPETNWVLMDQSGNFLFTQGGISIDLCFFNFSPGIYVLSAASPFQNFGSIDIFVNDFLSVFVEVFPCADSSGLTMIEAFTQANPNVSYIWSTINGNIVAGSNTSTVFVNDSGTYCVEVFDFLGCSSSTCVDVTVSFSPTITTSSITACLDPPQGACANACANTSVTYEAIDVPPNSFVNWQVLGAESYEVNGNEVTVEWGAPGQGEVSVSTGGGSNIPLQVYCGQETPINGNLGEGYFFIEGGVPPYFVEITGPNGITIVFNDAGVGHQVFGGLQESGSYCVSVTDNSGISATCCYELFESSDECGLSGVPNVEYPTSCNACDGFAIIFPVGGIEPYDFQWSNGVSTQSLNNVCEGTYSVTISDTNGCTSVTNVTITCPSNCSGSTSLCIDILENPIAQISALPPPNNGTIEICQGQTVYFENHSLAAESYIWDFGNFNTSTQFAPSHTYHNPGTYTVSLIARNECFCNDTTTLLVNVLDADFPNIECAGTICEGETVTYSTDADCNTYLWAITGDGIILDGGGTSDNFTTVEWLSGPEGTIELSTSGCVGSICPTANLAFIPIISDAAQIEGEDRVCQNAVEEYVITDFGGTDFQWSVSNGGTIQEGQGSNRITVEWLGNPTGTPQWVAVEFENCYLDCSGKDTLNVKIVPEFYIAGPIQVCEMANEQFFGINAFTSGPAVCNWQIIDGSGTTVWASTAPSVNPIINWSFPVARYVLRAEPANLSQFCTDSYQTFIEIIAEPPAPTGIDGITTICPGEFYTYEALTTQLQTSFHWVITDGANQVTRVGKTINYAFGNTPPYQLSVTQISTNGLPCESDATSLTVHPILSVSIAGDTETCIEHTNIFQATFYENVDYTWVLTPSSAGTIVSGQSSEEIEVIWHEAGNVLVSTGVCGLGASFSINVNAAPEPVVAHPIGLCPGEMGIASVVNSTGIQNYFWYNENGGLVSTTAIPQIELEAGYYEIEIFDNQGCKNSSTFHIEAYPLPKVAISAPIYLGLCPGGPGATIVATASEDGYDYQWFFGGLPVGTNAPTYFADQPGLYQVIVTDQNGCTGESKLLELEDCESAGGICVGGICTNPACDNPSSPCVPAGNISFVINNTNNCLTHDYVNTSTNFIPGSLLWEFGDPAAGANNTSILENPSHTFQVPGYFSILLTGLVPDANNPNGACLDGQLQQDIILAVADFEFQAACPGLPTEFTDLSTFVPAASISTWQWNFGDPASGGANLSNQTHPIHIYNNVGSYNVTLTITESSGCQSAISKTVEVHPLPLVSFAQPSENCEGSALGFVANVGADVTSVEWNFGDPVSGNANESSQNNTYHAFDAAGVYPVTLTATNIYGCSESFTLPVMVEPNGLTGNILFSQPSPICDGDSITLTAPTGGVTWEWSNGAILESIVVKEAGVFEVTVTDSEGCFYTPDEAVIDIFPLPEASISAVEFNEFGQPVGIFENIHAVCEGEDVALFIQGSLDYSYVWSNGEPGEDISFTEEKNNLLPVGTHNFMVTITDNTTSCQNTAGPYVVVVHPLPTNVFITSTPNPPLCENTQATLSVQNPDANLTYIWNTGESGTSIEVVAGGTYFVRAINQFGCEAESNKRTVGNAPDIKKVPSGCHTRCKPDTICLPNTPTVSNYQWYHNGMAIPAPEGTVADYIATESGEYFVEMTDVFGCSATSGTFTLDLYDGFGTLFGNVYFDVNNNGIIDAPDTLVNGINVFLNNGSVNLDTVSSIGLGIYTFANILSTNYTLLLDTLNLPLGWEAVFAEATTSLFGCDVENQVDWLLQDGCLIPPSSLELTACEGESIIYDGTTLHAGDSQDFTLTTSDGCDSTVSVTVLVLEKDTIPLELTTCENETINYNSTTLAAGEQMDFTFLNEVGCDSLVQVNVTPVPTDSIGLNLNACETGFIQYSGVDLFPNDMMDFVFVNEHGCDSTVTVMVDEIPSDTSALTLTTCEGGFVMYQSMQLLPGEQQDFTFVNQIGCDSIVSVSVFATAPDSTSIQLDACENSFVMYAGTSLFPGDQVDFTLADPTGCDSIVTVSVVSVPKDSMSLQLSVCQGGTIDYNSTTLAPGDVQDFMFVNELGCDSIVTVMVQVEAPPTSSLQLEACENGSVEYEGVTLFPSDMQDFTISDPTGCDSIVTVSVVGVPKDSAALQLSVCQGGTLVYEGTTLAPGDQQDFTFVNELGCDSIVTVLVQAEAPPTSSLQLDACENGSIIYEGVTLMPGDAQDFTLTTAANCDSIVTVSVVGIPPDMTNLQLEACENGSVEYEGVTLLPGDQQDFTFTNQFGCDSIVNVSVQAIPTDYSTLNLTACDGSSIIYNGTTLLPNSVQDFTFTNQVGCDSVVTVVVASAATHETSLTLEVCQNETTTYEGQELQIGSQMPFVFLNQQGCDSTVLVSVAAFPEVNFELVSNEVCHNAADGTLEVVNIQGSTAPYLYALDGSNFQMNPLFENLPPLETTVTLQDVNGCEFTATTNFPTIPPLEVVFENAFLPCELGQVLLAPQILSGGTSQLTFQWSDGSTNSTLLATEASMYSVQISNECETIQLETQVEWGADERSSFLYLPNAFSPNGDAFNDEFKGYLASGVEVQSYELMLFDRWGNLMFEAQNIADGWNGKFQNEDMDGAVFVYLVKAKILACGRELEVFRKGDVVLVR